jgi:glucose/arabinose dehydrogenase
MLGKVILGRRRLLGVSAAAALAAPAIVRAQQVLRSSKASYTLRMLALDLEQPWGMAFLPDGRLLVTERPGRLRIFANGRLERSPVGGLPKVFARGQGGLLDICLHPDFARNARLYLTYSGEGEGGAATVLARAEFRNNALVGVQPIFEALPRTSGSLHFGSRAVFDRAGLLYVTCGERYQMQRAQNLADLAGKVVRLRDDGTVPPDNPFVGREGARPEIFTYGHRNPQGMAMHPGTGRIWLVEHGPRGGDELNLLKAGANYGWPRATHGIDYSGSTISPSKSLPGMGGSSAGLGPVELPQRARLLYRRPLSRLEGLGLHRRPFRQRPVSHRARRRSLCRRGAVARRPASLYPRRSPGAGRPPLPRHPHRQWGTLPPGARLNAHADPRFRQRLAAPDAAECRPRLHDRDVGRR